MTIENEVANLTTAVNELTAEYQAELNDRQHNIDDFIATAESGYPHINLLRDGGRFTDYAQDTFLRAVNLFDPNISHIVPYNGTSTPVEVGKFIQDNITNGGSAGVINQVISDLLIALDRVGDFARYGSEFYVAEYIMGSGTASSAQAGKYGALSDNLALSGLAGAVTTAYWLEVVSGEALIVNTGKTYVNEIKAVGNKILTAADGWTHVSLIRTSLGGYTSANFGIYADPGTVFRLALPVSVPAKVQIKKHTAPLTTL